MNPYIRRFRVPNELREERFLPFHLPDDKLYYNRTFYYRDENYVDPCILYTWEVQENRAHLAGPYDFSLLAFHNVNGVPFPLPDNVTPFGDPWLGNFYVDPVTQNMELIPGDEIIVRPNLVGDGRLCQFTDYSELVDSMIMPDFESTSLALFQYMKQHYGVGTEHNWSDQFICHNYDFRLSMVFCTHFQDCDTGEDGLPVPFEPLLKCYENFRNTMENSIRRYNHNYYRELGAGVHSSLRIVSPVYMLKFFDFAPVENIADDETVALDEV